MSRPSKFIAAVSTIAQLTNAQYFIYHPWSSADAAKAEPKDGRRGGLLSAFRAPLPQSLVSERSNAAGDTLTHPCSVRGITLFYTGR